jgi:hypothetical protein
MMQGIKEDPHELLLISFCVVCNIASYCIGYWFLFVTLLPKIRIREIWYVSNSIGYKIRSRPSISDTTIVTEKNSLKEIKSGWEGSFLGVCVFYSYV